MPGPPDDRDQIDMMAIRDILDCIEFWQSDDSTRLTLWEIEEVVIVAEGDWHPWRVRLLSGTELSSSLPFVTVMAAKENARVTLQRLVVDLAVKGWLPTSDPERD
jgi:hypothetical protein